MLLRDYIWLRPGILLDRVVFVTGAPRSGTSLIKNLLAAHSKLCGTLDESTGVLRLRDFSKYGCPGLGREKTQRVLAESDSWMQFYDNITKQVMLRHPECQTFVDKVNVSRWRFFLMRKMIPNARYINIVRDGRDAYCSARKHLSVWQAKSLESFARYWCRCVRLPDRALDKTQLLTIRYEALVTDPVAVMAQVMSFLGLAFEPRQLDPENYSKTTILAKRPHHANLAQPISPRSVGSYRQQLSADELRAFVRIAGDCLADYGYQD